MGREEFPMFGICPVCSSDGGDYPASELTSADSQTNIDESREGVPLVWYQGKKMCEECKERLMADAESLRSAERHAAEKRFRNRAGFGGIT